MLGIEPGPNDRKKMTAPRALITLIDLKHVLLRPETAWLKL